MFNRKKKHQKGMLALDAALALTMLALISYSASGIISLYMDMGRDNTRQNNLNAIKQGLDVAYAQNANAIESSLAGQITFPNPSGGNFTISTGVANATTFDGLSAYMTGLAAGSIWHDGNNQGAQIFISNPLTATVNGVSLNYRNIAVVMPGNYTTAWPTNPAEGVGCPTDRDLYVCSTFNVATGQLNYAQDDGGAIVFSTLERQKEYLGKLEGQIERITKAYEDYFTIAYYNDITKSYAKDYFAGGGGSWGSAPINQTVINANATAPATIITECTTSSAATLRNSGLSDALGLSNTDLLTPWGNAICVDNASNNVRNPNNTDVTKTIAPYSARIVSALPGNQLYAKTVIGAY